MLIMIMVMVHPEILNIELTGGVKNVFGAQGSYTGSGPLPAGSGPRLLGSSTNCTQDGYAAPLCGLQGPSARPSDNRSERGGLGPCRPQRGAA